MDTKVCAYCQESKSLSKFWDKKGGKLGKNAKCIDCFKKDDSRKTYQSAYNKERWQAFKNSPEYNQVTEQQKFHRKCRIDNFINCGNYEKAFESSS